MIKKTGIMILALLFSVCIYGDIQFIAPASGTPLTVGTSCQIQWSGPAAEASQLVTVFIATPSGSETGIVSNTHTKGEGGFTWEVGRLQNGDLWKTAGSYNMWLESLDGDSGDHSITLVPQPFGLDNPAGGETLTIGSTFNIQWHGPTYEADQIVATFIHSVSAGWYKYIDNSHTKGQGGFAWEVGKLKDGTVVPPGQYTLSIESPDGDGNESPLVTLEAPQLKIPWNKIYKELRVIDIFPDPPCRGCFKLDLKNINVLQPKIKGVHTVKLFRNNRQVVELGRFGPRQKLPGSARIKLNQKQLARLKQKGKVRFQIRVFSQKGKLLHSQDVMLQISKAQLLKLNSTKLKMK
jgi:hypothetical protein